MLQDETHDDRDGLHSIVEPFEPSFLRRHTGVLHHIATKPPLT